MTFLRFPLLIAFLLVLCIASVSPVSAGASEEDQTLSLFSGEDQPLVSTGRTPRPISSIAENVTVITVEQIALLNAHTLADVLNTVPGIQLEHNRTPGSFTDFYIQGATSGQSHLLVLIDGIQQNNFIQGMADPGLTPVQQIERIEIVKGSASAAWGAALGGVVNVITKSPEGERAFGGSASASIGERTTANPRGEVSGTVGRLGYYLSGGNLHSDGLLPNNGINQNNGYLKLTYDIPTRGSLTFGASIRDSSQGIEEAWIPSWQITAHDNRKNTFGYSFLSLSQPLAERLILEMTARGSYREDETFWGELAQGGVKPDEITPAREAVWGGGAKLSWGDSLTGVVTGVDYDHIDVHRQHTTYYSDPPAVDLFDRTLDRWGVYSNGAFSLGRLTILPGIRFDHTGVGSDSLSYTLGATFRLTEKTVLRGYGARGYGLPLLNFTHGPQKVWTVQTGIESSDIPYLWLKGTLFYNYTWDIQADVNQDTLAKQTKQGFEVEARTVPWYGFSLAGGYTYIDAWDRDTHERLPLVPKHGAKLALQYDDSRLGLRGIVTGNYVWWNSPPEKQGKYNTILWDLHLTQKLPFGAALAPELFFSVHNLFNSDQYSDGILYKNAPRWLEGGVRWRF